MNEKAESLIQPFFVLKIDSMTIIESFKVV
jgi:hypothetical protein